MYFSYLHTSMYACSNLGYFFINVFGELPGQQVVVDVVIAEIEFK